jgi:hypothetical protein
MIFKNNFLFFIFNIILKLLKNINIIFFYIKRIFFKYPKKPKTEIISREASTFLQCLEFFKLFFTFMQQRTFSTVDSRKLH